MTPSNLDLYIQSPNDYIIQVGEKDLTVLKKGLWTWLKIHVGSLFGLFDKTSVQLNEVAKYAFAHKNEIDAKVCLSLDKKITFRNLTHSPDHKILTIDRDFMFEFPVSSNGNFAKWLSMKENEVSAEVINILPRDTSGGVDTARCSQIPGVHQIFNGGASVIALQRSGVPNLFGLLKRGSPDLTKVMLYLNGETTDGAEDLYKLGALGCFTDIFFFRDWQGGIQAKIKFRAE